MFRIDRDAYEGQGFVRIPGSHREPVHEHVPDARPGANYGYVSVR